MTAGLMRLRHENAAVHTAIIKGFPANPPYA